MSHGVLDQDRSAGEPEELGLGKEGHDVPVRVAELRAMTFVEDEDDAVISHALHDALVPLIRDRVVQLLDRGDDQAPPVLELVHEGVRVVRPVD